MIAFIKQMFSHKMARHTKRKELQELLKKCGLSIVYIKNTSITLGCFGVMPTTKRNRVNLTDSKGNILEANIKEADINKFIKQYEDAATKQYPDLPKEQALAKYLDELVDIRKGVLPQSTNARLKQFADEVINSITKSRDKKGAVCAIQYGHKTFYGKSIKGLKNNKLPKLHPLLDNYIKPIWEDMINGKIQFLGQHGKCAEVDALNQLFYYLEKTEGRLNIEKVRKLLNKKTISKALDISKDISKHGMFKKACKSCNPMLEYFEIIEDLTDLKNI